GVLFTFPSRYYALSVARRYLALEGGPPGFPRDSTCPVVLRRLPRRRILFAYAAVTLYGGPFQILRLRTRPSARSPQPPPAIPATPPSQRLWALARRRFGLFPVRSPLLRESRLISFPRGTEMFHFPRFPSLPYGFRQRCRDITPGGLPHSEIP